MQKIVVYWRDIPAQVIFKRGRNRGKAVLSARFQEAIDRAAMRAGKGGSEAYMADWRRDTSAARGDASLEELARAEVSRIEAHYTEDDLVRLVAQKGLEEP